MNVTKSFFTQLKPCRFKVGTVPLNAERAAVVYFRRNTLCTSDTRDFIVLIQ